MPVPIMLMQATLEHRHLNIMIFNLDRLTNDLVSWHNLWVSSGRPSSGTVQRIKCACKLKYKSAIKDAYVAFENELNDELFNHVINKFFSQFWKFWNDKFRKISTTGLL